MSLKGYFEAITPENIKDIPLIQTAMKIFIENLEENSQIASAVRNMFDNAYASADTEILQKSKLKLRKGLLDVYLSALYQVLLRAQSNDVVKAKFDQSATGVPFFEDIERILNDEYFITNKTFKEKVGTNLGVEYAYNLTKYLESATQGDDFNMEEIKPFHFRTDGTIFKEMYENIVKPLSHPLGFTFEYNQIVQEAVQDLFGIEIEYKVNDIEVRNLDGSFVVFTPDDNDDAIKEDFLTRINPATEELFTEEEYGAQVTVFTNKTVTEFEDKTIEDRQFRSILFEDGTYIQQYSNPIEIIYVNYDEYNDGVDNPLATFEGHWSLYVQFDTNLKHSFSDEIEYFVTTLNITDIKEENNGHIGQKYYTLSSGDYAFHVGGDSYEFAPGTDESNGLRYVDTGAIKGYFDSKFGVTLTGKTEWQSPISVRIEDDYGEFIEKKGITPDGLGNWSLDIETSTLSGKQYTITSKTEGAGAIEHTHQFKSHGLNQIVGNIAFKFGFDDVRVKNLDDDGTHGIYYSLVNGTASSAYVKIYDSTGAEIHSSTFSSGNRTYDGIGTAGDYAYGPFKMTLHTINPVSGKIENYVEYHGHELYPDGRLVYANIMNWDVDSGVIAPAVTTVLDIEQMAGFFSTADYIEKEIGELAEAETFSDPDEDLYTYANSNGYIVDGVIRTDLMPESVIINGSYIEGSSYQYSDLNYISDEETFINTGRKLYPVDTSDFIIMTSADYCHDDDFIIYTVATDGHYLYTDENEGFDYYFYSTEEGTEDGYYLTTLKNPED